MQAPYRFSYLYLKQNLILLSREFDLLLELVVLKLRGVKILFIKLTTLESIFF